VLGCSVGGSGHLMRLVSVAGALRRRGDDCVVLVPPSLMHASSRAGVRVVVGQEPAKEVVEEIWERVRTGPPERVVGLIDQELFAELATDAMLQPARSLCAEFVPDLVVRESCEYATAMAAHQSGVPQVQVGVSRARIDAGVLGDVSSSLERRCPGVTQAIRDAPYLTAFPEALDPSPWRDTRRYRDALASPSELPSWWSKLPDRPLVYVTFGTVLGTLREARGVYRAVLDAIADLPIRALMTIGHAFAAESLGQVPDNTHVEQWVPQADVFAAAQVVVCHGGSGTTNGALAAGRPLVVCPLFADQNTNADAIQRIGAGVVVRSPERPPVGVASLSDVEVAALSDAIMTCLHDPSYRHAAHRQASAIATTPSIDELVRALPGQRR
jgi:UDP:flavonoid glycosyltransferase YjiC (YdhE family)